MASELCVYNNKLFLLATKTSGERIAVEWRAYKMKFLIVQKHQWPE